MAVLDKLTGILLVAAILSTILFGVLTVQTYIYLARFPDDHKLLRWVVIILWVLDLTQQACACRTIRHYVINFRDPAILARITWSIPAIHCLEPIQAVVVQIFFVHRFHSLNPKWWPITAAMVTLVTISFCFGFTASILTYSMEYFHQFSEHEWLVITWLVVCAACDALIAAGIAYSLRLSRTGIRATDRLIAKLIVWTINTGAFPAFFAILELALFLTMINSFTFIGTEMVLAKLYSNSLLAFLNRRKSPLDHKGQPHSMREAIHLTTLDLDVPEQLSRPISRLTQPQITKFRD